MKNDNFTIRLASEVDAVEISQVMQQVWQSMKYPSMFVCDDLDFIRVHIAKEGFCLVACEDSGKIAASLIVRIPGMSPDNLGYEISMREEQLLLTAHMESAVVLPEHRGYGLQSKLISHAEGLLMEKGYSFSMATVDPENMASLYTLQKSGYEILKTTEKYDGKRRHILLKILNQEEKGNTKL